MYDLIQNLINHTWITQGAGDQQYIYYICGALICLLTVIIVDFVYRVLRSFLPHKG